MCGVCVCVCYSCVCVCVCYSCVCVCVLLVCVCVCVDVFAACERGDLATVKELLPLVKFTLNEFVENRKENLLMW